MALLYGPAGGLTCKNGDSRPGQCRQQLEAERGPADADGRLAAAERRAAEAEADLCPRPPGAVKRP